MKLNYRIHRSKKIKRFILKIMSIYKREEALQQWVKTKDNLVCAFCGEEQINEDEDGNTHCISGCYNTDIISWEDYCERDSDAIEWASEQAILQMQEEYGDKYSSLIYEEDNVISYTEDGQEIYDELFGEYYQDYMRDRS